MDANYEMLKARYAEEQRDHPVPLTAADLPFNYEAITPLWLTKILCANDAGAEVIACELGPRDEGTSSRRRLHLKYNEVGNRAGLPASVFCKSTQSLKSRYQLALNGFAEGEVLFYNHLRSQLAIEAPHSYFANFNAHTFNSIIIMRDMASEVTFCGHAEPMNLARAQSQLKLLATLHAKYYDGPATTQPLSYLRTWDDTFTATANNGFDEACWRGFTLAEEVIPPALFQREAEIWPATLRSVERHRHLPLTVVHSDPHLKNWYINANGDMGLNDWQCVCRGHWARDVSYALSTALEPEDRRRWERELITYYLACMQQAGVPEIPFHEAWTHYRQQLFGALAWWTGTLGQPPNAPEMQPRASSLQFIRRITTAIDDLAALESFEVT
jgi:thiamine kinase-like enzyme